jgi:hypothetical protein
VVSIAPTSGTDIGGTIVTVFGHNFVNDSSVWTCRFQSSVVPARVTGNVEEINDKYINYGIQWKVQKMQE